MDSAFAIRHSNFSSPKLLLFVNGPAANQMKLVHVDDTRIAVARRGKGYLAFHDRSTHKGGPLSDGVLACGTVQCP